jgi:hypothetical protein
MEGVLGSSLLPICRDHRFGNVFFVLGKERTQINWNDGNRWADFSGSTKFVDGVCEQPEETAAREAWEETATILRFSEKDDVPLGSYKRLLDDLKLGHFVLKIVFERDNGTKYVTFVYEVPWDPGITTRFSHLIKLLTQRIPHTRATAETQRLSESGLRALFEDKRHPSIDAETGECDRSFTEKSAIGLFSVQNLVDGVRNNGKLVEKFGKNEYMRDSFIGRLVIILKQLGEITSEQYDHLVSSVAAP